MNELLSTGQTIYALAASPEGVCFAAHAAGLERSVDGGRTWQSAYASIDAGQRPFTAVVALSPAFASDRTVWAGVAGGVLRSDDGGVTWRAGAMQPPPLVSSLAVSPAYPEDGVVLAGSLEDGVYCSADGGRAWQWWNFGILDRRVLCLAISPAFARDGVVYAGAESGLFRSTNGGKAWRETGLPRELAPVLCLALSPAHEQDGTLWIGAEHGGLQRSRDRGRTWQRVGASALSGAVNAIVLAPTYPAPPHLLVIHEGALLISRDDGESWEEWAASPGSAITAVAAPEGLRPGARILAGLFDGRVVGLFLS